MFVSKKRALVGQDLRRDKKQGDEGRLDHRVRSADWQQEDQADEDVGIQEHSHRCGRAPGYILAWHAESLPVHLLFY